LPDCSALGEKSPETLVLVGGAAETSEDVGLGAQTFVERFAVAAFYGLKDAGDGQGRHVGNSFGQSKGAGKKLRGGHNFVDQAKAKSFGRIDDLGSEHHPERGAATDEARESLGSAVAWDEAEFDLRKSETSPVAGEAQGASKREFTAAAECDAVDGSNDGLAAALDLSEDLLAALGDREAGNRVGFGKGADVGTRSEGAIPRAGNQYDANRGVGGKGDEDALQLIEHGAVQGVENLWAVEGYSGRRTLVVQVQSFNLA
jgi:hypothetical protein